MKAEAGRPYSSPLRAEQAAATRDRIVDAAVVLLRDDPAAFGMQDVAERAGVSVRTVYRAFPTKEDLVEGVLAAIRQRFEQTAGSPPTTRSELRASVAHAVRAVDQLEPLYRALFATAAGRESHRTSAQERAATIQAALDDGLDALTEQQRRLFVLLVRMVTSSHAVLWLKDYGDLDVDAIIELLEWALAALDHAVADPDLRDQLGGEDRR